MLKAQDGDPEAYRTLLEAVRRPLKIYFLRRVGGDDARADDLVQETLLAVHAKRAAYDPSYPLSSWMYGIARYKLIDHYRRNRRHMSEPLEAASDVAGDNSEFERATARSDIERLMTDLPDAQASSIRLMKLDGMTASEAGEALGASEASVKVRVHRGLKTLARRAARGWGLR